MTIREYRCRACGHVVLWDTSCDYLAEYCHKPGCGERLPELLQHWVWSNIHSDYDPYPYQDDEATG